MHSHSLQRWQHDHVFLGERHARHEQRTWAVVALTIVTMVIEIAAGSLFGSMALLADGWHMATHAGALSIAALAYAFARRHARTPAFTFGTGKVGDLAGFTSAVGLAVVALMIAGESLWRLVEPTPIRFNEAIAVACLGLAVNLASAALLHDGHDHDHDHHHHEDHNHRAAYFHVLADALTSILAIAGLLAGRLYGWVWLDPLMGLVGALVIGRWSWGLMRDAGLVLLDAVPDRPLAEQVRDRLERSGDHVTDLHLWRLGPGHTAAVITLLSSAPQAPEHYRSLLAGLPTLSHVTVEVNRCDLCEILEDDR